MYAYSLLIQFTENRYVIDNTQLFDIIFIALHNITDHQSIYKIIVGLLDS